MDVGMPRTYRRSEGKLRVHTESRCLEIVPRLWAVTEARQGESADHELGVELRNPNLDVDHVLCDEIRNGRRSHVLDYSQGSKLQAPQGCSQLRVLSLPLGLVRHESNGIVLVQEGHRPNTCTPGRT